MSDHQTAAHSDDYDHGTYGSYLTGFILSVILTAIPFAVVMNGGLSSSVLTILLVTGFAIVQVVVHAVYFLHLNGRSQQGWTFLATLFTIVVVVIMFAGSLWVMFHLNENMMPMPAMTTGEMIQSN